MTLEIKLIDDESFKKYIVLFIEDFVDLVNSIGCKIKYESVLLTTIFILLSYIILNYEKQSNKAFNIENEMSSGSLNCPIAEAAAGVAAAMRH